jgi:GTP-binding protein
VFVLVDSRHPGLDSDRSAWNWLGRLGVEKYAVATKVDKLTRAERQRHLGELERLYSGPVMPVSAETGEGLDALWKKIANLTTRTQP